MAMQYHRDDRPEKVTPPGSFITAPLTPPPTDSIPTKLVLKILRIIQQCKRGRPVSESEWHTFKLQPREYDDLLTLLENEESLRTFVETRLRCAWTALRSAVSIFAYRYDYNSSTETLFLRMPSQLHDVFIARVVEDIQSKLRAFTDAESRSRAFARKIKHKGPGRLDLFSEGHLWRCQRACLLSRVLYSTVWSSQGLFNIRFHSSISFLILSLNCRFLISPTCTSRISLPYKRDANESLSSGPQLECKLIWIM